MEKSLDWVLKAPRKIIPQNFPRMLTWHGLCREAYCGVPLYPPPQAIGPHFLALRKETPCIFPSRRVHRAASIAVAGLSFAVLAAAPACAQNLVKDGNFEQADSGAAPGSEDFFDSAHPFDLDWTITQGIAGVDTQNHFVYDGDKGLYLNASPVGMTTTIAQTLATTPGQNYTLSFYADQDAGSTGVLTVGFGSTTFPSLAVPANGYNGPPPGNDGLFTFYSGTVTATSAFTVLTFSSATPADHGGLSLDDISVIPAAVPEASTTVSLGLQLALPAKAPCLAPVRRGRRRGIVTPVAPCRRTKERPGVCQEVRSRFLPNLRRVIAHAINGGAGRPALRTRCRRRGGSHRSSRLPSGAGGRVSVSRP